MISFAPAWRPVLSAEFGKDYWLKLQQFLAKEYAQEQVFPNAQSVFYAFELTPPTEVKVVILGQDPYHGQGQAQGLAFSVPLGMTIPPSLKNILQELNDDLACPVPEHGCLKAWAKQGVLLLNTVLTVRMGQPGSHQGRGWEQFTDAVLQAVNLQDQPVVFILWGSHAHKKAKLIDQSKHLVLSAPHPSPLSVYRGFWGAKPFSKANAFLIAKRGTAIDWCLADR